MLSRRVVSSLGLVSAVALSVVAGTLPADAIWSPPPPRPTPGASGDTISVSITGTGVGNGNGGRPGHTSVKQVPVPCNYMSVFTGKSFYEFVQNGGSMGRDGQRPLDPYPGYEKYKDDDRGRWYSPTCSSELFGRDWDAFVKFSDKFFAEHHTIYVPAGERPPVPPVPPEILRQAAFEAMTVPGPKLNWNPKMAGNAGTVVNLDTWVWLDDYPKDLYVRASVGTAWAQVDAKLTGMDVSAPDADPASCADAGTPYAPGATSDCTIRFRKASPGTSKTPVTVQVGWTTTWTSSENGEPQATPDQLDVPPTTAGIQVLEVQTQNR